MQLSEIRTQFSNMADDPDITAAQANAWINAAYRLLVHEYDWSFMVDSDTYTVTSGTAEQTFAGMDSATADFATPLRVWIADSSTGGKFELSPINYEDRNRSEVSNSYYITPDALSLGLVATPTNSTDVVTIDFIKSVTDLSADTDTPIFMSDFHYILVWAATVYYQKREREVSDEYEAKYHEVLNAMLKFYKMPQAATNPILSRGTAFQTFPNDSPFKRR